MYRLLAVTTIFTMFAWAPSHSQIPQTISYQGVLTDGAGAPVADGAYDITFKLYDAAGGGSALWTETRSVTVSGGIFSAILGASTPLDLAFNRPYWLGVAVNGGAELSPRRALAASPYSLNTNRLADSTVTGDKIQPATVVRNLNGLSNDVTLAGGSNIDVAVSGDTIRIDATGVGTGDITGVVAGGGLDGGGSAGEVTVAVGAGPGIAVTPSTVNLDTAYTDNRYVNAGEAGAVATAMLEDNAVTQAKLGSASVTGDKLAPGAAVTALNGLSGDVTLEAGANVTITSSGDTLTLATTGAGDSDWTVSGNDMYSSVTGNVGVGTTSPSAKLDVAGDVNTDTDYKIDGYTTLSVEGTSNLLVGTFAGRYNTGNDVVMIGSNAGRSNEADYSTFVGSMAGYDNTTGHSNMFIGFRAGRNNTTGSTNTFIGREAGRNNTTGGGNTFVGYDAGLHNTTAYSNTFLGNSAGVFNETGAHNTFVGRNAGAWNNDGRYNSFLGADCGYRNTTGRENVFVGSGTGYENTTGNFNTVVGRWAGRFNQTGEGNIFIGYNAGSNETGSNKLYIDNTSTSSPLIYGEFDNHLLSVNGELAASGRINTGTGYHFAGD